MRTTFFPVFSSVTEKDLVESTADDIRRLVEVMSVGETVIIERHQYDPGKNLFTVTTKGFDYEQAV